MSSNNLAICLVLATIFGCGLIHRGLGDLGLRREACYNMRDWDKSCANKNLYDLLILNLGDCSDCKCLWQISTWKHNSDYEKCRTCCEGRGLSCAKIWLIDDYGNPYRRWACQPCDCGYADSRYNCRQCCTKEGYAEWVWFSDDKMCTCYEPATNATVDVADVLDCNFGIADWQLVNQFLQTQIGKK